MLFRGVVSIKSKLAFTDFSIKISVFSKEAEVSSNQNFIVTNNCNQAVSFKDRNCNFSKRSSLKSMV